MKQVSFHQPVLLKKSLKYLNIKPGEKYIDATLGGGGHTLAILKSGGHTLSIDCDPEAIQAARKALSHACPPRTSRCRVLPSWRLIQENFVHLKTIAHQNGFKKVAGILFDLGVSTHQLKTSRRGFSFNSEEPLDMRMDPSLTVTAADLINGLHEKELSELFEKLGDEHDKRIAAAICQARKIEPIKTCQQLTEIIVKAKKIRAGRINPATRCFQALRIAINDELNNLKKALPQALTLLKPKGRLVIISFHSGEDRIVKQFFKKNKMKILTKKPVQPSESEIKNNPASRSAKLRAAEK